MIAVTGASGHLGQWVVARLTALGHDVIAVSRRPLDRPTIEGVTWARPVRTLTCDLSDTGCVAVLGGAVSRVRGGVHLAAHIPVDTGRNLVSDAAATLRANVRGTIHLIMALGTARLDSLVYASTFEVYGEPQSLPIQESHRTEPETYYGASKLIGERYLDLFGESTSTPCCALRLPAVYGPGSRIKRALENFIAAAATGGPIAIQGDGSDRRELVYVADAAEAVVAALNVRPRGAVNLGSGRGYSIREMAEAVRNAAGGGVPLVHRERVKPRRDYALDIARARAELEWTPRTPIEEGIRAHLSWVRPPRS